MCFYIAFLNNVFTTRCFYVACLNNFVTTRCFYIAFLNNVFTTRCFYVACLNNVFTTRCFYVAFLNNVVTTRCFYIACLNVKTSYVETPVSNINIKIYGCSLTTLVILSNAVGVSLLKRLTLAIPMCLYLIHTRYMFQSQTTIYYTVYPYFV